MKKIEKITVVTICYNSEKVICPTLESMLHQTYDGDVEYIIIDGASTDNTCKIAQSYQDAFARKGVDYRIYSEPDAGIYDAMNKGIAKATGDIIGLLNSGDTYERETLQLVVDTFEKGMTDVVFGNIRMVKTDGSSFVKKARQSSYQTSRDWNHPTMFVKAMLYKENPFPCKGIHDDYGLYLRFRKQGRRIVTIDEVLASFYMGGASNKKELRSACRRICDRYQYCYRDNGYSRWYLVECVMIEMAKWLLG